MGGGTLTRFSPEPRAAAHLPLQSGASVMQGDSEENTDRRGEDGLVMESDRQRRDGEKMAPVLW